MAKPCTILYDALWHCSHQALVKLQREELYGLTAAFSVVYVVIAHGCCFPERSPFGQKSVRQAPK